MQENITYDDDITTCHLDSFIYAILCISLFLMRCLCINSMNTQTPK